MDNYIEIHTNIPEHLVVHPLEMVSELNKHIKDLKIDTDLYFKSHFAVLGGMLVLFYGVFLNNVPYSAISDKKLINEYVDSIISEINDKGIIVHGFAGNPIVNGNYIYLPAFDVEENRCINKRDIEILTLLLRRE